MMLTWMKNKLLEEENELNQIILVDEQIFEKEDENNRIEEEENNPLAEKQIGEFKKLVDYSSSSAQQER
uniref:Candidate secreted effector n=1 Tax=Meloidogyne incognita TaxID=6306 RepID=A0A914MTU0_MELIC